MKRLFFVVLTLPLARLFVGVAGLAGVGAGAYIAWRANAATPLLIVAAILVALALFDWTELTAKHGESSFTLRRAKLDIEEVAQREDVPEPAREKLQAVARTVDLASIAALATPTRNSALAMALAAPTARLEQDGEKLIASLSVVTNWTMLAPTLFCAIASPSGAIVHSTEQPWGARSLTYPDDFNGAETLMAGDYVSTWYQRFPWDATANEIAQARHRVR